MTSKELKQYIYDNDKIVDVLQGIGMHSVVVRGSYITCGFPDGDNDKACSVKNNPYFTIKAYTREIENNAGLPPDIIDLVRFVKDYKNSYDAMKEILRLIGLQRRNINKTEVVKDGTEIFKKLKNKQNGDTTHRYDKSILEAYNSTPHISLLKDDWITPEYCRKYNLMYDEMSDRILFPHFAWNDPNTILALVGRTVNPAYEELKIPKYLTVMGVGYRKENNLYGLTQNIDNIKQQGKVIIFESEKSVIKADQCGYGIGVSVGCHDISINQIKILLSLGVGEIIIAFDKDVKLPHLKKYNDILSSYVKTTFIYDSYDILKDKQSPIDRGLKIFSVLFKNRKTYEQLLQIEEGTKLIKKTR